MNRRTTVGLSAAALALALVFAPKDAHAGIAACGNIDVKANANCKVEVKGGCNAQCTPVKFEAACSAKFQVKCDGRCNAEVKTECTAVCGGTCNATCNADPGKFDCKANCSADCEGECATRCQGNANGSECQASCKGSCSARCDASCSGTPPSASCQARCGACCSGSCKAKVNLDCNATCQAETYASCKGELSGGCKVQCEKPEGALFCDGNYVDTGGNLASCIDALKTLLNLRVDIPAQGSANCTGTGCTAEGEATANVGACELAPAGTSRPVGAAGVVLGLGAVVFAARRRRRAS